MCSTYVDIYSINTILRYVVRLFRPIRLSIRMTDTNGFLLLYVCSWSKSIHTICNVTEHKHRIESLDLIVHPRISKDKRGRGHKKHTNRKVAYKNVFFDDKDRIGRHQLFVIPKLIHNILILLLFLDDVP